MKFKNAKTKKIYKKAKPKEQKFPRNYRNIPEKLNRDEVVFFVGMLCLLTAILIISLDLYSNFRQQEILTQKRTEVLNQIAFWQSEIKTRPNYRDAYMSLALLNFQLRDLDKTRKNLDKALNLDPNFEKGRELEKLLNSN